jgi:hypothetical protein
VIENVESSDRIEQRAHSIQGKRVREEEREKERLVSVGCDLEPEAEVLSNAPSKKPEVREKRRGDCSKIANQARKRLREKDEKLNKRCETVELDDVFRNSGKTIELPVKTPKSAPVTRIKVLFARTQIKRTV